MNEWGPCQSVGVFFGLVGKPCPLSLGSFGVWDDPRPEALSVLQVSYELAEHHEERYLDIPMGASRSQGP